MSELTQINRRDVRWQLLTTVSALALASYVSSTAVAMAEDGNHPTVWLELGGQMELMQGTSSPFSAPFMSITPTPQPYREDSLFDTQKPPQHAFGFEGKIIVEPQGSDWTFSAGIRYGRANTNRHVHHQTGVDPVHFTLLGQDQTKYPTIEPFADTKLLTSESHAILDFRAGKDVGLGFLGHEGNSTINFGIRFAQFSNNSNLDVLARPSLTTVNVPLRRNLPLPIPNFAFYAYTMSAHAERSFRGIGPSLEWNGSAVLAGSADNGALSVDWGIDGALLFGRQKAKNNHETQAYHQYFPPGVFNGGNVYALVYSHTAHNDRSRSVFVPNLGGFGGISMRKSNAKVSFGYRADFFFGAVDTGIDARQTKTLGFHGPFATISIGLGG